MPPRPGGSLSSANEDDPLITPPDSPTYMKLTSSEVELQKLSDDDGRRPLTLGGLTPLRASRGPWLALLAIAATFIVIIGVEFILNMIHGGAADNGSSANGSGGGGTPGHHDASHLDPQPFSLKHPVDDLKLRSYDRPHNTKPPTYVVRDGDEAMPTNSWYQNMLMLRGDEPSSLQRVYTMPYVVDTIGPIPGVRVHPNTITSSSFVMQLTYLEDHGLTVGAAVDAQKYSRDKYSHGYNVSAMTDLGLTLEWESMGMSSNIVKGMPYATMQYRSIATIDQFGNTVLPTVATALPFGSSSPIADGVKPINCGVSGSAEKVRVDKEVKLYFEQSDFEWLVFFSAPVKLQCVTGDDDKSAVLQVTESIDDTDSSSKSNALVIRVALLDSCTTGRNNQFCRTGPGYRWEKTPATAVYANILRNHAGAFPGSNSSVSYHFGPRKNDATLVLDYDAQQMWPVPEGESPTELITFALPHHLDRFSSDSFPKEGFYCASTLIGPACVVKGASWHLPEPLPDVSFRAPRPPPPEYIPRLADALSDDINYTLPEFFLRGAGDTYFSGKMLSKLARILSIAEEVDELCDHNSWQGHPQQYIYAAECSNATRPSKRKFRDGVARLRSAVEIWLNGTGVTPFVYDPAWGGVVSCGCLFDGEACTDTGSTCPAFEDQGLNFGNAYYNDMHFHYGYFIYAAASVAHFDPDWGRQHFEQVLLLVRNIANPSKADSVFPRHRHKDWYQGSSWASGIPEPVYLNGKNQESSSEAIMSYEAVALFGDVMAKAWDAVGDSKKRDVSENIHKVGQVLTATELRSAKRYWHVTRKDESKNIYPEIFKAGAVGIIWSTMAQFGTWFGASPYLAYGIQLLPLTPISEERDDLAWANEVYYPFSQSCASNFQCTEGGWSILQLANLATVGHRDVAVDRVKELPETAYTSAGGNGHSKSNTLWYLATRPVVADPIQINKFDVRGDDEERPLPEYKLTDCYSPKTCPGVLDAKAGEHTCRQRIEFLITAKGMPQWQACTSVGYLEYPDECGGCDPEAPQDVSDDETADVCPPCTQDECDSDLNRCPIFPRTFVCTDGPSRGGCSGEMWEQGPQCNKCCETTKCHKRSDEEAMKIKNDQDKSTCPPCAPSICYGKLNQCPIHAAPYLCVEGANLGGCSPTPWANTGDCSACCEITVDC